MPTWTCLSWSASSAFLSSPGPAATIWVSCEDVLGKNRRGLSRGRDTDEERRKTMDSFWSQKRVVRDAMLPHSVLSLARSRQGGRNRRSHTSGCDSTTAVSSARQWVWREDWPSIDRHGEDRLCCRKDPARSRMRVAVALTAAHILRRLLRPALI